MGKEDSQSNLGKDKKKDDGSLGLIWADQLKDPTGGDLDASNAFILAMIDMFFPGFSDQLATQDVPYLSKEGKGVLDTHLKNRGYVEGALPERADDFVRDYRKANPDQDVYSSRNDSTKDAYAQSLTDTPKGVWSVSLQQTDVVTRHNGKDLSSGYITVTDPEGNHQSFEFVSGGHGKGPLPGLESGDTNYQLRWDSFVVNSAALPKGMVDSSGRGSWLKIGAGEGAGNDPSRGGFGIHTDGNVPGSLGCIVLEPGVDKQLFEVLASIPKDQRPAEMNVLPPSSAVAPQVNYVVAAATFD